MALLNVLLSEKSIKIEPLSITESNLPLAAAFSDVSKVSPLKSGNQYYIDVAFSNPENGVIRINMGSVSNHPLWTNDLTGIIQAYNDISEKLKSTVLDIESNITNTIGFNENDLVSNVGGKAVGVNPSDLPVVKKGQLFSENTIVIDGDSITEQCGHITTVNSYYTESRGYWPWANFFLNQRFKLLKNDGVGGHTTINVLAGLGAGVLSTMPKYYLCMAGINDINALNEYDENIIFSRLVQIWETVQNAGIKVIACTVTHSSFFSTDPQKLQCQSKLNQLIRNYAKETGDVILCDMAHTYVDVTTGYPLAGYTDNTHPYGKAAIRMGKALADTLNPLIKEVPIFGTSMIDANLINPNPFMLGNTAGVSNNFTITGTGSLTNSKEVRDGGLGEYQVVEQLAKSGTTNSVISTVISSGWSVGEEIFAQSEIILNATDLRTVYFELFCLNSSYATIYQAYALYQSPNLPSGIDLDYTSEIKGVFRTENIVIPPNTAHLRMAVRFDMAGTLKVGRTEIRRV